MPWPFHTPGASGTFAAALAVLALCGASAGGSPSPPPSPPPLSFPPPLPPPPCADNRAWVNGICVECATGLYADRSGGGLAECSSCAALNPKLTTAGPGAAGVDACICNNPIMVRSVNGSGQILCECPAGTYYCAECEHCMPCPRGTFQPTAGAQTRCQPCSSTDAHLTTASTGATSLAQCACEHSSFALTRAAPSGAPRCECPPGSEYDIALGWCVACARRTYKATTSLTDTCRPCSTSLLGAIGEDAVGLSSLGECVCGSALFEVGQRNNGQDECQCPAGMELNASSLCESCAVGHYKEQRGTGKCKPCPAGTYREGPPATSCVPCPAGYYNDATGQTTCKLWCARHTFSLDGARSCSPCGDVAFSTGGDCTDGVFNGPAAGFWSWPLDEEYESARAARDATRVSSSRFYPCADAWACAGGLGSACMGKRVGPLCSLCPSAHRTRVDGRCERCEADAWSFSVGVLCAIVFALVIVIGCFLRCACWIVAQAADEDEADVAAAHGKAGHDGAATARSAVSAGGPGVVADTEMPLPLKWRRAERVKILLTYLQVLASLTFYSVKWPCVFAAFLRPLRLLLGDLTVLPLSCLLRGDDMLRRFAIKEALALSALLISLRGVRVCAGRLPTPWDSRQSYRYEAALTTARLAVCYVTFPMMSLAVLQLFECVDLGRASYVAAEMSIECGSDRWWLFAMLALGFGALHIVGVPAYFLGVVLHVQRWPALPWESHKDALRSLVSDGMAKGVRRKRDSEIFHSFEEQQATQRPLLDHLGGAVLASVYRLDRPAAAARIQDGGPTSRSDRLRDARCAEPFGLAYAAYTAQLWWWESVECARKLLMLAFIKLCAPGSMTQIVVGLCVAIVYAVLVATAHPYSHGTEQRLAQACNLCVCALLAAALALRADDAGASSLDCRALSAPLLLVAALPLVVALLPHPLERLFAPPLALLARCCGFRAEYDDDDDDEYGDDEDDDNDGSAARRSGSSSARSRSARKGASELTADEIAEAQDALDDFLMDDAAFIWTQSTLPSPRGSGAPVSQSAAAGLRPATAHARRVPSTTDDDAERDTLASSSQPSTARDMARPAPDARAGAAKSDRSWAFSGGGSDDGASPGGTPRDGATPPAAARSGGGDDGDDGAAPAVCKAAGKADRDWRYSEVTSAPSNRTSPPKEDSDWRYSEVTSARTARTSKPKSDRSWRYSQAQTGRTRRTTDESEPGGSALVRPQPGGAQAEKEDTEWQYSQRSDGGSQQLPPRVLGAQRGRAGAAPSGCSAAGDATHTSDDGDTADEADDERRRV
ncbi:hypothetical protein KFE25_007050 [Diacronema lutheri]|uniref:Tyrosine-protein kinase ephrin type A/B receptor-like domain-containing protein n=2 Tax=Diacronema lutheri TaxID=2081491 RepID=A0A8J5XMW4_DIALT|nr:hypothetical protein KFE25_007050 [Diacronema lutheri]